MKPRAALVWNPVSGVARDELPEVVAALEQTYELTVFETSPERDADACAAAALASEPSVVIAAGGDGTVSLVASRLIGGEIPLAVLPRGTANSFARALAIPLDLEGALENACKGQPHAIDTARAAGRAVLLFASVGFHAAAIGETTREAKNRWGLLAYIATGLQRISELEPFAVELETESEVIRCKLTNVAVANLAPLHTLFAQGPTAVCGDDGQLDVTLVAFDGLVSGIGTALHLYRSGLSQNAATRDDIGYLPVKRVTIRADPPQPVLVDGEDVGETPVTVECVPRSLRVLVPAPPPSGSCDERKLEGLPELEVEPKPD
ncbi:YegS/Rv2252/BmrU family lipid kinase [Nannocystis bainbridge]|uniref:YegS/Rv2252/BmrU family lipid kinase n=1 Tax=Nannocystis bainbridge TaxID=2995303 RepID=A0ABT5DR34_9BACT|nr:YegS/Rv2252/BmrU family lipid kinase [Nannocystis bainbridge]MDC0716059.1 YegS/Rv2252/BmrU family lipid kinase [Nannocystis bainbridge]